MKHLPILFLLFLIGFSSIAQNKINLNQGSIEPKRYTEQIPYHFVKGKILVNVEINRKQYKFLLDTGAPFGVSEKIFNELQLETLGTISIKDASGKTGDISITQLPELKVGNITFKNATGLLLNSENDQLLECFEIDGIIGSNMLRNSVIHFDHLNHKLILSDRDKNIDLKGGLYQRMELSEIQSNPFIKILLKKGSDDAADKLLFDTGADSFYELSIHGLNWLKERVDVFDIISESQGSFTWGIHGMSDVGQQYTLKIPELIINEHSFKQVVTTTTNSTESRIGSELLKKGKVTLDYNKKRFYFDPYDASQLKNTTKKNWAIAPSLKDDKMVVGIIWDKNLEDRINLGDEILSIEDMDYESMTFCERVLSDSNFNKDTLSIRLRDVNTNEIKEVEVSQLK